MVDAYFTLDFEEDEDWREYVSCWKMSFEQVLHEYLELPAESDERHEYVRNKQV